MKRTTEIGFNAVLFVFSVGAFIIAQKYKYFLNNGQIGPGFIPVWASGILAAANLLNIILLLFKKGYAAEGPFFKSRQNAKNILIFTLMVVVYMAGVMHIGMYCCTFVFMICVYRFFDKMPWKNSILVTCGTLLFIYLVFHRVLHMNFPAKIFY